MTLINVLVKTAKNFIEIGKNRNSIPRTKKKSKKNEKMSLITFSNETPACCFLQITIVTCLR
jgi:hypothetical protein